MFVCINVLAARRDGFSVFFHQISRKGTRSGRGRPRRKKEGVMMGLRLCITRPLWMVAMVRCVRTRVVLSAGIRTRAR